MTLVEESRDRVVGELRGSPDGLDVRQLADRLGLHPNTVRWHLGALVDAGAVTSAPGPHEGRGRPRIVYRLEPGTAAGTRDEYRLLATILSGTLAAASDGSAAAEAAGRTWGRYLVARPSPLERPSDEQATARVVDMLAEQGFAPETGDGEIRMRRCPFHDLAEAHPEIVCTVHKGLMSGALEELGSTLEVEGLDVFVRPDLCIARLGTTRSPNAPSTRAAGASRA